MRKTIIVSMIIASIFIAASCGQNEKGKAMSHNAELMKLGDESRASINQIQAARSIALVQCSNYILFDIWRRLLDFERRATTKNPNQSEANGANDC